MESSAISVSSGGLRSRRASVRFVLILKKYDRIHGISKICSVKEALHERVRAEWVRLHAVLVHGEVSARPSEWE